MSNILVSKQDKIGIITLNDIEIKNTLNSLMLEEIAKNLDIFEKDESIRAVVVKGQNGFFASGIDVAELLQDGILDKMQKDFGKIDAFSKPLIASISGACLGAGFELAMACDIILASDDCVFALPETSLNFIPCFGGIQRLLSTLGKAKTMEIILTNRGVLADEAFNSGIISRIVPLIYLDVETIKVAQKTTQISSKCLSIIRESLENEDANMQMRIGIEKRSSKLCILDTQFQKSLIDN